MSATQSRSGAAGANRAPDQVSGPLSGRVGDRGALDLAPDRAGQPGCAHQPLHRAPGHLVPSRFNVQPHLPGPVDAVVLGVNAADLSDSNASRRSRVVADRPHVLVVGRRGDLQTVLAQHGADRLDTPPQPTGLAVVGVLADELHDQREGRSSSAAKKADAAFKIALARFSSAFSRFNRFTSADSSVRGPGPRAGVDLGLPAPTCGPSPASRPRAARATRVIAAHSDSCSVTDLTDHPHRPLLQLRRVPLRRSP